MNLANISCVVPTLNSATTLDTTLLSIHSQEQAAERILVVDSGSMDGTTEICQRWNVPTMYAEPGNMYRAINAGLRSCQTEWLTYVNSDDWLYPDSFSRLIALGEKTKADVVYGNCDFVDGQGRFLYSFRAASPRDLQGLFGAGVQGLAQPAAIFSRRLFERLDGFDEKYELAADADFFSRAISTGASFKFLAGPPTACFRQHEHQLSQTRGESMATECQEIRRAMGPQSRWEGWVAFTAWRMAKLPHYAIRTLRAASLGD